MVRLSETYKQFIQTVINHLPPYIKEYPADEQQLLNEFLDLLKCYKEADYQREQLSNRFIEHCQQMQQTQKYLETPFLWFTLDYFTNASLILSLAKFDGKTFYEYLTKPLKRSTQTEGLFSLIKNKIPLMDLKWENLQVTSTKMDIDLLDRHLITLDSTYKTIEELGVNSLNSTVLWRKVQAKTPKFPYMRDLENFHRLVGSYWTVWFYPPAFDLNRFYFHFSLLNNTKISDFIDYTDLRNTALCNSRFYYMPESKNEYCGYLTIPSKFESVLKEIIDFNQEKEKIIVKKYEKITMEGVTINPSFYKKNLSKSKRNKLPIQKSPSPLFLRPNNVWNFKEFVEPTKLIRLYCNPSGVHYFNTLPLNKKNIDPTSQNGFSALELGLMKYLYKIGVCRINYVPERLVYFYSAYQYEIILPSMLPDTIERLISWMPFTRYFQTKNHTFLWPMLTPATADWIRDTQKWPVRQIIQHHYPTFSTLDWYNFETCEWKKPLFIKDNS